DNKLYDLKRQSLINENPFTFSVSRDSKVKIKAKTKVELALIKTKNKNYFKPIIILPRNVKVELRGSKKILNQRFVKTSWDYFSHPESNLVIGEVVTFPGNSSSYPPHGHLQPEIYLYKIEPEQGYGLAKIGDNAFVVKNNDAIKILEGVDHPQYSAPGYVLWYLWVVRHLPNNPYKGFKYVRGHRWLLKKNVKIWKPSKK
ncbi:5-deoxy-glucuronate isomerase, partial [bacterium]|nr:5-deoxy-glucuronate isomerase [bacterium]